MFFHPPLSVFQIILCRSIFIDHSMSLNLKSFMNLLKIIVQVIYRNQNALGSTIHLLNLITILQWYTEINRKQMRYLTPMLQIWHA